MKYICLLLLFIAILTYSASAQKVYIGCPDKVATKPKAGFLDKQAIDLVILDSRAAPTGESKIECDANGIKQMLNNFLQSEFPSCQITQLPDTLSNKAPNPDRITIKVEIKAYQASLANFEWTGSVSYHVTILDNRHGKAREVSEDISNDTAKPTIGGYKVAKKCLFTSFDKSNQDLASFMEESLK